MKQPHEIWGLSKTSYKVQREEGCIYGTGTDLGSWFTYVDARDISNSIPGSAIILHDGYRTICEVF